LRLSSLQTPQNSRCVSRGRRVALARCFTRTGVTRGGTQAKTPANISKLAYPRKLDWPVLWWPDPSLWAPALPPELWSDNFTLIEA
jgi:hypothetical protein